VPFYQYTMDNKPWGDRDISDDEVDDTRHETDPKEKGIKYVSEYRTNESGQRVKITKKIKVYKNVRTTNKRAEERRKRWKKFGKCAGVEGPEAGVTGIGEEVSLILGDEERKAKLRMEEQKREEEEMKRMYAALMAAPTRPGVGGAAPSVAPTAPIWVSKTRMNRVPGQPGQTPSTPARQPANPLTYVSPRLRGLAPGQSAEEETSTIRVTNLSEDTTEEDLRNLFRPFGGISRIYLAKDKVTMASKGFAFINFMMRDDAQAAMEALNGTGWDYLILNIEWAKPSTH